MGIKVCHITSAHGVEDVRIFHKECVSLAQAGYEVYLVERGESYDKNGVHIVGVGEMLGGRLKRMTEGARRVYEVARALEVRENTVYRWERGFNVPPLIEAMKLAVLFKTEVSQVNWWPYPVND